MQPNYTNQVIRRTIATNMKYRDNHIQRYGIQVMVYTNNNMDNLTSLGEVSYFAKRQGHIITILPNFSIEYEVLSFNRKGRADETVEQKPLEAFLRSTDNVNKGDIIEVTYSFLVGTLDKKYYQVGEVLVNSVYDVISKRITLHPYYQPVSEVTSQAVDDAPLPIANKGFIL